MLKLTSKMSSSSRPASALKRPASGRLDLEAIVTEMGLAGFAGASGAVGASVMLGSGGSSAAGVLAGGELLAGVSLWRRMVVGRLSDDGAGSTMLPRVP